MSAISPPVNRIRYLRAAILLRTLVTMIYSRYLKFRPAKKTLAIRQWRRRHDLLPSYQQAPKGRSHLSPTYLYHHTKRANGRSSPARRSPKVGIPILQPSLQNIRASSSRLPSNSRKKLGPHVRQALALKASTSYQPDDSHQQMKNVGDQRLQGSSTVIEPGTSSVTKTKVC